MNIHWPRKKKDAMVFVMLSIEFLFPSVDQLPDVGKMQIEGVTGLLHQVIQIVTQEGKNAVGQVLSLSPSSSPTTIRKFRINVESRKVRNYLYSQDNLKPNPNIKHI